MYLDFHPVTFHSHRNTSGHQAIKTWHWVSKHVTYTFTLFLLFCNRSHASCYVRQCLCMSSKRRMPCNNSRFPRNFVWTSHLWTPYYFSIFSNLVKMLMNRKGLVCLRNTPQRGTRSVKVKFYTSTGSERSAWHSGRFTSGETELQTAS